MVNVLMVQKNIEAGIRRDYTTGEISQAHGEVVSCFGISTEDNILQPYIIQNDFINDYKL